MRARRALGGLSLISLLPELTGVDESEVAFGGVEQSSAFEPHSSSHSMLMITAQAGSVRQDMLRMVFTKQSCSSFASREPKIGLV